nr:hypothetical protein [Flaviflexus massiliensis]
MRIAISAGTATGSPKFVVNLEKREGGPRLLQRGAVLTHVGAPHLDALLFELAVRNAVEKVLFGDRGAAQAVDHEGNLVTGFERKVWDNGAEKLADGRVSRSHPVAVATWLAVNTHNNSLPVIREGEDSPGSGTGGQHPRYGLRVRLSSRGILEGSRR